MRDDRTWELADQLGSRFPDEADLRRIVDRAGLDVAAIARDPRPLNHWRAVIVQAVRQHALSRLLDEVIVDLPSLDRARYLAIATNLAREGAPSLQVELTWQDAQGDRPWRVQARGKRLHAIATVRAHGATAGLAPTIEWRERRTFQRTTWCEARGDEQPDGAMWCSTRTVEVGWIRPVRLELRARLADQEERIARLVLPQRGVLVAFALLGLAAAFGAAWLWALPGFAIVLGTGGAGLVALLGVVAGMLPRDGAHGPCWGLAVVERAALVALFAIVAVVTLPPLALVVLQNQTKRDVKVRPRGGGTFTLGAGESRTVGRWSTPLHTQEDKLCVCPADRRERGCHCGERSLRGVPVHHVGCRHSPWPGIEGIEQIVTRRNATTFDGLVWLAADDETCAPLADATAAFALASLPDRGATTGIAEVRYPWHTQLKRLRFEPGAASDTVTIAGATAPGEPWLTLTGLDATQAVTVPALERWAPTVRVGFDGPDGGTLECNRQIFEWSPAEPARVLAVDLPDGVRLAPAWGWFDSVPASVWRGGRKARFCDLAGDVTFEIERVVPGLALPVPADWTVQVVRAGSDRLLFQPLYDCHGPAVIVAFDHAGAIEPFELVARATAQRWLLSIDVDGPHRAALVCDPPAIPTEVTVDRLPGRWELSTRALRRIDAPHSR